MKSTSFAVIFMMAYLISSSKSLAQQYLFINEFMAENDNCWMDPSDHQFDDWIEIYNGGSSPINLANYFLTDTPFQPTRWPFPNIPIAPGAFLLIWADEDSNATGLHANFKLNKAGEFVGLYYQLGTENIAIDTLSFGPQTANISLGRFPDGSFNWRIFAAPTPGAPNRISQDDDASAIVFDDNRVHNYELHFYIPNWCDSLAYYYEYGQLYMPAQLIYEGFVLDSIGVRYKGNSSYNGSRRTLKKPLKFKFDKYKKSQTLFGLKELNFSNCFKDPSFMREKIGYDIIGRYVPAPRACYSNIYVDGQLLGFYVQVEQVDKTFLARHFGNNSDNLYKATDKGSNLAYLGPDKSKYKAGLELKTNEDLDDWSGLLVMLEKLNNTPASVFQDTMEKCLNLDQCCRLLAFDMVLSNFDSYIGSGRNFYLYDDSLSGQFQMIPWDLNETFGGYINNWNIFTVDIVNVPNLPQRPLMRRIIENELLRQNYLSYIKEMMLGPASNDSVALMADRLKALIDPYVRADKNKLYSYQNFLTNIETDVMVEMNMPVPGIKSFSKRRNENLKNQLDKYLQTEVLSENSNRSSFALRQNYPNPFNTSTIIAVSLSRPAEVKLEIFDLLGKKVATIFAGKLSAGEHKFQWQAAGLSSGIYSCTLQSGSERKVIKTLLLK
ncbi:MAG: CotH kinase family protein [candidate division KSB1 bacterium]|nr:CotH kinase family protein [candidate division KSB1 bacterium]MDZ7336469.1 CotH kinase family protein [candidate division KSB1 bacterium]MDZ7357248.1 CotH kinase family protein [candidate division KSB1 bacterium]MDZ7402124.1 CotH kinase family protein [candidate division KSB1 bacterium]